MGFQGNTHQNTYQSEIMKSIVGIIVVLLLLSCGKSNKAVSDRDKPEDAAVYYMQCIVDENYDEYINAMISCDSASADYKDKMRILVKQMVRTKKAEMDSCKKIECLKADVKYDGNYANTFMRMTYANDSTEIVILPLVWDNDRWRLR